jgi:hypothetical protein
MMIAICADIQIVAQFTMEQHGSAFIAFRPKVLGHIALREHRIDPWADVVGDPVHWVFSIGRSLHSQ